MVKKPIKISCKILKFEENQKGGQNVFIECRIGQRVWIAERWMNYDAPISFEKFIKDFSETEVIPKKPKDNLAYVKQEADKPFEIEYTPKN